MAQKHSPSHDRRNTYILIGVGLAMVAVLVAVVLLVGNDDDTTANGGGSASQQTAPVKITGDALPTLPETGNDPAVGSEAPQATGEEFGGNEVTLLRGEQPTMVVFGAHWCPHCQREIPLIADWMGSGGTQGIDVVLVATATNKNSPNYPPSAWLDREGWKGRVILDDEEGSLAKAYGLTGYPLIVFVDAEGKVTKRVSGEVPIDQLATYAGDVRA
jgi:thiol-disulfide isomerase/thioredoxin